MSDQGVNFAQFPEVTATANPAWIVGYQRTAGGNQEMRVPLPSVAAVANAVALATAAATTATGASETAVAAAAAAEASASIYDAMNAAFVAMGIAVDEIANDVIALSNSSVSEAELAAANGLAAFDYTGAVVQNVLDNAVPMQGYTALRAYTGRALGVRLTTPGVAGTFQLDAADTTSADNGGTIIVDASARRWKRLFDGPLYAKWFGAAEDNIADDTAALNALTSVGLATGRRVVGRVGATYKTTGTVHINCDADFGGSIFAPPPGLAAAAVKTSGTVAGSQLKRISIKYPTVDNGKADGAVPTAGSIGIQIQSARNCRFEINTVHGFEDDLQLFSDDGTSGYVAYNSLYFNGVFYGAKTNIHLKTASTGWVNQCQWFGGQFAQVSVDAAAYTATNVKITKVDNVGNNPPNGHTFVGCSMEGAFNRTIQYSLPVGFASTYFSCNTWLNCRFEAAASMEFSDKALYDSFVNCYGADLPTYVGSIYPSIVGSTRRYRYTLDVAAIPGSAGFRTALNIPMFQPGNSGSAAGLAVGFIGRVNATISGSGDFNVYNPGNDTSLYPMASLRMAGGLPRLEMGAGTAAPTTYITWSNDFRVQGHWNPNADVTYNLGSASLRYTNVYASNFRPGTGTATWTSGAGTPEGAVTAAIGSLFTRTDGGAGTTLYVKESGAGNTGWVAK